MEFSSKRQIVSAGVKQAVLAEIYDLGEVETKFGIKDRCRFIYETTELKPGTNVPLTVMIDFNKSWSNRSNLWKHVEATLGRNLTTEEQVRFTAHKLVGVNNLLTIVHRESGGNVYANITNISPIMPGMTPINVSPHYVPYEEVLKLREERAAKEAERAASASPYVV